MRVLPLSQGRVALVDDEDHEWLSRWKWSAKKVESKNKTNWYAVRAELRGGHTKIFFMHREIMRTTKGQKVDHRDGCGLNNQRSNLRFCSQSQNMWNACKAGAFTSRYKGVSWDKSRSLWRSSINFFSEHIFIGRFQLEIQAAVAYNARSVLLFGEFANRNIL